MRLKDKVAIVTGGSRGIGLATVRAYLKEGAIVILCASRLESAEKAAAELKKEFPEAQIEGIAPDLSNLESVKKAFDAVAEKYGRIDILVNNAGISESTPFAKYEESIFDKVMDLNVKGIFTGSKAAADIMVPQGSGVILNNSSMVSLYGQPSGIA